jgi:hypothetical protein
MTVYLILYLWHASGVHGSYSGGTGGPALTITAMSSLEACEAVGRAAKSLADENGPEWANGGAENSVTAPFAFTVKPAAFRCVRVQNSKNEATK